VNDAGHLGVGLHVCTSIKRTADGNLAGTDCDQDSYSSMDVLYACVVGRPPTVHREIRFVLNGSIVDKAVDTQSPNVVYMYPLDDRFLGSFHVVYVENGCNYWAREFVMGVCPTALMKPAIEVSRLVELLHKFRMV
jgi:hypothetical protein